MAVLFLLGSALLSPVTVAADEIADLKRELRALKAQMAVIEAKLEAKTADTSAPAAAPAQTSAPVPVSSAATSSPGAFNPAIGLMIDGVASAKTEEKNNFEFRSAEISISANVDPYTRGYASINGTSDEVEVEEAALVTTALPYNLAIKGGRFFADFGRLSTFHDHDLPFVNRPVSLDTFVGGESQADGVELSYLVPVDRYLNLTAGAYDKIGSDNERVDSSEPRGWNQFTYLVRANTSFDISDADEFAPGVSYAYTPDVASDGGGSRSLAGVDLTYRHQPLDSASYNGFIWSMEYLFNSEDFQQGESEDESGVPSAFARQNASGLYTYGEVKLSRRYAPGFMFDWAQALDRTEGDSTGYSPYLTIWISEYQRLRLQYTYQESPGSHDNQFYLQWTAALGDHSHGFKQR